MKQMRTWIDARDKAGLLLAMMKELSGNSRISFEGDLSKLRFSSMEGASFEETSTLKRQTTYPELDFVVLPLTEQTVKEIWRELSEKDHLVNDGVVHVQIEVAGKFLFGGYDNFHRECTIAYQGVSVDFLESLKVQGIIRNLNHENA